MPNNSCSYPSHILTILTKVFIHCSKSLNLGVPVSSMVTGPAWYCDRSYLCNTSSHKKSSLLNIPQSVVRGSDWDQQQLVHKVGVRNHRARSADAEAHVTPSCSSLVSDFTNILLVEWKIIP